MFTILQIIILLVLFSLTGFFFTNITTSGVFLLLAALVAVFLTATNLLYGLALTVFAIALSPEISMAGIPIRIEDLLIPVVLLTWIIKTTPEKRFKPTRMYTTYAFFLAFMAIATVNAFVVRPGTNQLTATFHFLKHVEYVFIFVLALNIVEDRSDIRFLMYATLIACLIVSIQANPFIPLDFGTAKSAQSSQQGEEIGRVAGVETETANIFGGYLLFHFMIALGFLVEEERWPQKIFFLIVILSIIQPMAFTRSRSTYTGFFVGLMLLAVLKRDIRIFGAIALAPVLAVTIFPDNVIERFTSIFIALSNPETASSWNARLEAWLQFSPDIIRSPLIGKGLFYVPMGFIDNDYVLRVLQTGILGLLSFLWVYIRLLNRAWNLFNSQINPLDRQLGLAFVLGISSIGFHALAATSFTTIRTAEPIFFLSGLVVANYLLMHKIDSESTVEEITKEEKKVLLRRSQPEFPSTKT